MKERVKESASHYLPESSPEKFKKSRCCWPVSKADSETRYDSIRSSMYILYVQYMVM